MPPQQISRSSDLKRLRDEGYEIEVRSNHLLLKSVPYVTEDRAIKRGTLVSTLALSGDVTTNPDTHVVMFAGERPCDKEGHPLTRILNSSQRKELTNGLTIDHTFSSKPLGGRYADYYEKMTTYANILSGPAQAIDRTATARTFAVIEDQGDDSVFKYMDTASSRAGIVAINEKLASGPIAIVGLGGTGSYILDLMAKTPVSAIHLFDGDRLGQHNAFRSPGAPSLETLKESPNKADYFSNIYSEMRHNIITHSYLDEATVDELRKMDFVFLALDNGDGRRLAFGKLEEYGIPFIDVGMGVQESDGSLLGQIRVTVSTTQTRSYASLAAPLAGGNDEDEYSHNIQIAELNALNAALAVVKWKKLMGFYLDLENETTSIYQIDGNHIVRELR